MPFRLILVASVIQLFLSSTPPASWSEQECSWVHVHLCVGAHTHAHVTCMGERGSVFLRGVCLALGSPAVGKHNFAEFTYLPTRPGAACDWKWSSPGPVSTDQEGNKGQRA